MRGEIHDKHGVADPREWGHPRPPRGAYSLPVEPLVGSLHRGKVLQEGKNKHGTPETASGPPTPTLNLPTTPGSRLRKNEKKFCSRPGATDTVSNNPPQPASPRTERKPPHTKKQISQPNTPRGGLKNTPKRLTMRKQSKISSRRQSMVRKLRPRTKRMFISSFSPRWPSGKPSGSQNAHRIERHGCRITAPPPRH